MVVELELFTLQDKYWFLIFTILALFFVGALFVWLESFKNFKKFQIKSKNITLIYISIMAILLILSLIYFTIPFLEQSTIKKDEILAEAFIDNENNLIVLRSIENAHYPTSNGSFISWYTTDFRDQRYLQSEKIIGTYISKNVILYELNDSRYLSIQGAEKPMEYRGVEVQSFYYSLVFVLYNILISLILLPLFSVYKIYIKLIWKSLNIISTILIAITLSYAFIF